jgi:hypothetical protein
MVMFIKIKNMKIEILGGVALLIILSPSITDIILWLYYEFDVYGKATETAEVEVSEWKQFPEIQAVGFGFDDYVGPEKYWAKFFINGHDLIGEVPVELYGNCSSVKVSYKLGKSKTIYFKEVLGEGGCPEG